MNSVAQKMAKGLLIMPIRFYQYAISPFTPAACRHVPSCSEYSVQAVNLHGPVKGGWLGLKRIGRCHPWGTSGFDPVPKFLIKKIDLKHFSISKKEIQKHDLLKPLLILIVAIVAGLSFISCNNSVDKQNKDQGKIKVLVSISPQKYFVEKIGGKWVDVEVLIPTGTNPHLYDPTPGQLINVAGAAVYFYNGNLDFEKSWINNLIESNPNLIHVKLSDGIEMLADPECTGHQEGHSHGVDPHTWLSPANARIIATHIKNTLCKQYPEHNSLFEANYNKLITEIAGLEKEIETKLSNLPNRKFMIFHPTLSYFAKQFGLEQISIEFEGKEPTPKHLKASIDLAKKSGIQTIFIQKEFDMNNASIIANELDGNLVQIDPLSEDWYDNLLFIANQISNSSKK
jgi:zinc transport system substrate-binding protein